MNYIYQQLVIAAVAVAAAAAINALTPITDSYNRWFKVFAIKIKKNNSKVQSTNWQ